MSPPDRASYAALHLYLPPTEFAQTRSNDRAISHHAQFLKGVTAPKHKDRHFPLATHSSNHRLWIALLFKHGEQRGAPFGGLARWHLCCLHVHQAVAIAIAGLQQPAIPGVDPI